MASLGLEAYRFSVAWPRIFPTGLERAPDPAGLDLYERLVDALLAVGIDPWVTLYHWDLPQGLQDRGGWPDRATAEHFARYAEAVARRLGDRVDHWITHNEPWCVAHMGHVTGEHAPGHQSWPEALATAHHVLLSHGLAVPRIRAHAPSARVGLTLNLSPAIPASPSPADAEAARWHDGWFNRWYLDPVHGRGYPEDMVRDYRAAGHLPPGPPPWLQPGDFVEAQVELLVLPQSVGDYYGLNNEFRKDLQSNGNTWKPVFRQAAGNDLRIEVENGRLLRTYPPRILVDLGQNAEIAIAGGVGYLPLTFSGLPDYRGWQLLRRGEADEWVAVDQSAFGHDFWQTDREGDGKYSITFNVSLDIRDGKTGERRFRLTKKQPDDL